MKTKDTIMLVTTSTLKQHESGTSTKLIMKITLKHTQGYKVQLKFDFVIKAYFNQFCRKRFSDRLLHEFSFN